MGYELRSAFFSPFFHGLCAAFLSLMGLVFFFSLKDYAHFPQEDPLMLQLFKGLCVPLLFIVPILTAKAIAGEKEKCLFDGFLLLPVDSFSRVFAKFFVLHLTYTGLWTLVTFFPELTVKSTSTLDFMGHLTSSQVRWGGWIFVNLIGGTAIAFGLLVSAHTETVPVAMIVSLCGIFLLLIAGQIFKYMTTIFLKQCELFEVLCEYGNVFFQLEDFCRGIWDTRVVVAYLTATLGLLSLTVITLREN
jgi:ABC-type transport system involved in multi-copper enzyme maturation permease subunit